MGLLDRGSIGKYHDAMTGRTGARAAKEAAWVQGAAIDEARTFTEGREQDLLAPYQPYTEAGQGAFAEMVRGSGIEGYGDRLSQIRESDAYRDLSSERMSDAARYLSSQGISRSSTAAERIGDTGMQTLMGMESELMGRTGNVAGMGYNALGTTTDIKDRYGQALRDLILRRGGVQASGILGTAEAIAGGAKNQYTAMHNAGSGVMQMFGSGMGGSDMPAENATSTGQTQSYQGNYNMYSPGYTYNQGGYQPTQTEYWSQPI